jgi:methylglutaconyl-CoA hydratase
MGTSPAPWQTLRLERSGPILHVVLARPEVHDAFDERTVAELTRAFCDDAAGDGLRAVVLRSTGRSFCAGADVGWMRRMAACTDDENLADAGRLADMLDAIATCPRPVVARVQGAALGGGAGLVAACDLVVASSRAQVGFSEVRLGVVPAVISAHVLRKLAPGRAQALFLTGERFSAERARELGLVDRVVEPERLDEAVGDVLAALLQGSPLAQASVKRLVRDVSGLSPADARAVATEAIARARASADGREGLAAFLEKRRPSWTPPEER